MAVATHKDEDATSILGAIRQKALRTDGPFQLASGRQSNYFLDMKAVLNDADILRGVARLMLARIPEETTAVGGLAMGSIPISTAVIILRADAFGERPLKSFWVRREPKTHGLGGVVSGELSSSDRVVIVDDVTTTGQSILQAVEAVESRGAEILKVVSVVDRMEGAGEVMHRHGITFESIFTRDDILEE